MKLMGFSTWKFMNESLGDGRETFQQELDVYGKNKNISFYGLPSTVGEDYDHINGNLKFGIQISAKNSGLESMEVNLEELTIHITPLDEEGESLEEVTYHFTPEILAKCKVEIEVENFPIYLTELDIDMSNCEDADGEVHLEKTKLTAKFGVSKS